MVPSRARTAPPNRPWFDSTLLMPAITVHGSPGHCWASWMKSCSKRAGTSSSASSEGFETVIAAAAEPAPPDAMTTKKTSPNMPASNTAKRAAAAAAMALTHYSEVDSRPPKGRRSASDATA